MIGRLSGFAAVGLLISACGQQAEQAKADRQASAAPEVRDNTTPAPDDGASIAENGTTVGDLPPSTEPLRFVGLWAADVGKCETTAWRFTDTALSTPSGSRCTFGKVTPVSGGYDIAARCTAEGPEADDTIRLRFAESARAMMFESDSIADAGLVYCGELT